MELLGRAWRGFRAVMERVGNVQARILLTVFYFVPAAPFGIGYRLRADPLHLRRPPGWTQRPPREETLDAARRQY